MIRLRTARKYSVPDGNAAIIIGKRNTRRENP
jgi:hypothetical protein